MPDSQLLFGSYFFLATDKLIYHFDVYNIIYVVQSLGGIYVILLAIFKAIGHYINQQVVMAKFVRSLFYVYKDKNEIRTQEKFEHNLEGNRVYDGIEEIKCIKFSFKDKFTSCRRRASHSDNQVIFSTGKEKVKNEMNMFSMLQTI